MSSNREGGGRKVRGRDIQAPLLGRLCPHKCGQSGLSPTLAL